MFTVNNRVLLKKLNSISKFLSEENISRMREEYDLIDLLFRLKDFVIHGPTFRWLAMHGQMITSGKKKVNKLEFNFGGKKKAIFEPEHMALITGFHFHALSYTFTPF